MLSLRPLRLIFRAGKDNPLSQNTPTGFEDERLPRTGNALTEDALT